MAYQFSKPICFFKQQLCILSEFIRKFGQLLLQEVVTIGVRFATGNHNDGQVQIIQIVNNSLKNTHGIHHITNNILHSNNVLFASSQVDRECFTVIILQEKVLPLIRIIEPNSIQFLKGNLAVNINSAGAE